MSRNLFLTPEWLAAMRATGAIAAIHDLSTTGLDLAVGEVRCLRQARWVLFGAVASEHRK
ncbi:MAG: hypothetical protein HQM02_06135, partial [Magnetococcales bacterium]|nr:hypothetical protein [Magnetococcales bacterium]